MKKAVNLTAALLWFSAAVTFAITAEAQLINVHIVAHTHDDVGWLKTVDEYFLGANQSIQNAAVQYVIDSVVDALVENPERRFIYVEIAFFSRWWNEASAAKKQIVRDLVAQGRLEFINGGWCMNDEATTHYTAIIDQMTEGHQFILENFGVRPRIGWHIDPFGHSSAHAALFAKTGFDAFMFARMDYQDFAVRNATQALELIWRGFKSYGTDEDMFTHMIAGGYGTPGGFCFECGDPPINDDPSLFNVNIQQRADAFAQMVQSRAISYKTNNLLVPFGSDFQFSNANVNFKNMDKLIAYLNANRNVYNLNVTYSTPSIYIDAVHAAGESFPLKTDDFFPYADWPHAYWTGYFTSRAALKGFVRSRTNLLHAADQLFATIPSRKQVDFNTAIGDIQMLSQAVGVAQHHDAVSGTEKQHVAYDYAERLQIGTDASNDLINKLLGSYINTAAPPSFVDCPYLNVSQCSPTTSLSAGQSVAVVLYNPIGWPRTYTVRLPISSASASVLDSTGASVFAQVYSNADNSSLHNVAFQAKLPAMGFATYFVQAASSKDTVAAKEYRHVGESDIMIDTDYLIVNIDSATNRISSITNKVSGATVTLDQNFFWYNASTGNAEDGQASGAYIFRPNSSNVFDVAGQPSIQVVGGLVLFEVRQTFSNWLTQVIRVYNDSAFVELESTIGPVPIDDGLGKEVISRYTTNINTGNYYYTDTNGLEMLERQTDYRPTWNLTVTEPVSCNYYPLNTAGYIKDVSQDLQLTVVTDRSHGAASLTNGEFEVMMQRRLLHDDRRGVGEALNESAPIRVYDKLVIDKASNSARQQRTLAQYSNYAPLLFFAPVDTPTTWIKNYKLSFSPLQAPLPDNVRIETLKTMPDGTVLLRLAHLYAVGEDSQLSQNVTVDVSKLFTDRTPVSMTELTLTANRPVSDLHRLNWNVEGEKTATRPSSVGAAADFLVTLSPMDIRTFSVRFMDTK